MIVIITLIVTVLSCGVAVFLVNTRHACLAHIPNASLSIAVLLAILPYLIGSAGAMVKLMNTVTIAIIPWIAFTFVISVVGYVNVIRVAREQ